MGSKSTISNELLENKIYGIALREKLVGGCCAWGCGIDKEDEDIN